MLILSCPREEQPSEYTPIWSGHPLASRIAFADIGTFLPYLTKIGTRLVPNYGGIFRGFGTTYGSSTTDRINSTLNYNTARRTYFIKYFANSTGGGSAGRLLNVGSTGDVPFLSFDGSGTNNFLFTAGTSGITQWTTTSTPVTLNRWQTLCITWDGTVTSNAPIVYIDGVSVSISGSGSGTLTSLAGAVYEIGNRAADSARNWDGLIGPVLIFDDVLSAAQVKSLHANPWQMFEPQKQYIPFSIVGGGAYTLNLETGVYSFTGSSATLSKDSKLTLDSGSYALSGSNASLLKGLILEASSGSYSLSGIDASLFYTHLLNASSGSYSVTGSDATLTYTPTAGAYTLNLESGAYVLLGQDVTFVYSGSEVTLKAGSWIRYRIIT